MTTPLREEVLRQAEEDHGWRQDLTLSMSSMLLGVEASGLIERLKHHPPPSVSEADATMRRLAELSGTHVAQNDADPYGDGDQSDVGDRGLSGEPSRQILRDTWASGGDLYVRLSASLVGPVGTGLSPFAWACARGDARAVKDALSRANERERSSLLERRECGLRVSPLSLTVASAKITGLRETGDRVGVVRILLAHGANPGARDWTGKTVSHYGAGSWATPETLTMHEHCRLAYRTSHLFGKTVLLRNLSSKNGNRLNGKTGTLGGYLSESGRRTVLLHDDDGGGGGGRKELAIKPENIFVVARVGTEGEADRDQSDGNDNEAPASDERRNLVDLRDRTGALSAHEVIMSKRVDVATYLTGTCGVNPDLADRCDVSLRSMAFTPSPCTTSAVCEVFRRYVLRLERDGKRACWSCGTTLSHRTGSRCARCKTAVYCDRECQKRHWREHRSSCAPATDDVVDDDGHVVALSRPKARTNVLRSRKDGLRTVDETNYRRPEGVDVDERFWLKVQVGENSLLLYDKTRVCTFFLDEDDAGFEELRDKVREETAAMGLKTHVRASFDGQGNCKVWPDTATLKTW